MVSRLYTRKLSQTGSVIFIYGNHTLAGESCNEHSEFLDNFQILSILDNKSVVIVFSIFIVTHYCKNKLKWFLM
jgi:hypothetical protein